MKRSLVCYLLFFILLSFGTGGLAAQNIKLDRYVVGSGGMVEAKNSTNWKMSGIVGQLAIEKITGTNSGTKMDIWQGFWVPSGMITDVENPNQQFSKGDLIIFPNPVTSNATFQYSLPGTAKVTLKIYNIAGKLIKVLVDEIQDIGNQQTTWNTTDISGQEVTSGSYLYELNVTPAQMAGNGSFQPFSVHNSMVVIK